jgi:hypothetical protein
MSRRRRARWPKHRAAAALAAAGGLDWAWHTHPALTATTGVLAVLGAVAAWWARRRWLAREGEKTWLYRHYLQPGRPIYYGITTNYGLRCGQHAEGSWWWPLVDPRLSTCQQFPNRSAAEAAERAAIAADCPPGNTQHNWQWRQQLELRLWLMGIAAQMRTPA